MSYAVFKDGNRISRPFQTEGDAWDCANDAGAVSDDAVCRSAANVSANGAVAPDRTSEATAIKQR